MTQQKEKTGIRDAAVWGYGAIDGKRVSIAAMDFAYMGGSMGSVVGDKITRAAEAALQERIPYIAISTSGGARMQEGTLALMQLVKTCAAVERLARAGRILRFAAGILIAAVGGFGPGRVVEELQVVAIGDVGQPLHSSAK